MWSLSSDIVLSSGSDTSYLSASYTFWTPCKWEMSSLFLGGRFNTYNRRSSIKLSFLIPYSGPMKQRPVCIYVCVYVCMCVFPQTGKFFKRWEYQTTLPASWETCMQVKKQQLEPDMEQQTSSKLGKEYLKALYCYRVYLTYIQSTSCEMLGRMKHKLKSRLPGETSITSDMQMTLPLW